MEQMKKLINDPSLTDEQILEIRDQLYALAEIIYEKWQQDKKAGKLPGRKPPELNDWYSSRESIPKSS
ncbi:MAG TPA: hypothetical protein PLV50_03075 [Smithella sp.]|nr:hypothetical protein [Smithella sp.]